MKFRKKPIIIEAEQYDPDKEYEGIGRTPNNAYGYIDTLEGTMIVSPGDWIITGIAGEKYPCKNDIFKLTYEPVKE